MLRILKINDMHAGHVLGLMPPEWQAPVYHEWQRPFWDFFTTTVDQIGKVDVLAVNGDAVDGPSEKDAAYLAYPKFNDQVDIADAIARQIKAERRVVIKGTGYHTDRSGSYEEAVAQMLNCDAEDEWRSSFNGCIVQLRHVVGRSDTPYGQYTQDAKEMINEWLRAEMEDYEPARVIGRAHVHYSTGVWTIKNNRKVQAFTAPGLQLRGPKIGPFVRKLRTWMYHVGVTLIEIDRYGEAFIRPITFPLKLYMSRELKWIIEEEDKAA